MNGKPLRIAIAGLGTVGGATTALLRRNADVLAKRCGRKLELVALSSRTKRDNFSDIPWVENARDLASHPDIDVIVETIGGADGIAHDLTQAALTNKKHVVTANKALIATHGNELATLAERAGVALCFEAAVAGGIPILKTLREGLSANRISAVNGILNGTANFILTEMRLKGLSFAAALKDAQKLGYAEADPSFDIDGIDSAHKLAILAALAFGQRVDLAGVAIEGIRRIDAVDIEFASELGYRIKLLGIARQGALQRVAPCLVPESSPIATADGAFNAIVVSGDAMESLLMVGPGAGAATASAMVADLVDIALGRTGPAFGIPAAELSVPAAIDAGAASGLFYLRLKTHNPSSLAAELSPILRAEGVRADAVLQRSQALALTTHKTQETSLRSAVSRIALLESVTETPCLMRLEGF